MSSLYGGMPAPVPGGVGDLLTQQAPAPEKQDPLPALQDAIHAVQTAMIALPDPSDVDALAGAMKALTSVQKRLMGEVAGGAAQGR